MLIGKSYHFDAAHHIPGHGKCGNPHGHTYTVTVEISSTPYTTGPFILDFHILNTLMDEILSPLDHTDLNTVPDLQSTTVEAIAQYILTKLILHPEFFRKEELAVHSIKVQEGQGGYAIVS